MFKPAAQSQRPLPAIVIFHGGGWSIGAPQWGFRQAQNFAELGMIAFSAQYRLSDEKSVTPLDAMNDVRAAFRWVRSHADSFGIDPHRIAGYGWSAGGHLAASAAVFADTAHGISSAPDALVLISPALNVENDRWFKGLLLGREKPEKLSPAGYIRKGLPPSIILIGREHTVTPLVYNRIYHEKMLKVGNLCELIIYDNVGHLFTPASEPDYNEPNPDPAIQADADSKIVKFLKNRGFIQ